MGVSRKQALRRIVSLTAQADEHMAKLTADPESPSADHWKAELRAFATEVERLQPHVGKKTAGTYMPRVKA
jgi:hypothetical protein